MSPHIATWIVSALSVGGVMLRPFRAPEAVWAVAGAAILVVFGLITPGSRSTASPRAPTFICSSPA